MYLYAAFTDDWQGQSQIWVQGWPEMRKKFLIPNPFQKKLKK